MAVDAMGFSSDWTPAFAGGRLSLKLQSRRDSPMAVTVEVFSDFV
jgi:hypothetical protein